MSNKKVRDIELFVVDVLVAIKKIEEYTSTFQNEEQLRFSSLHWDATIRELEIIGEALNSLLDNESFCALSPLYFRKVVNFRNAIIHGYFGIDASEVWNIITEKIDILRLDLQSISKDTIDLREAIESQIIDYTSLKDKNIIAYLHGLLDG